MHWNDEAILLSSKKHGENSAVVRAFAREHGVYAGIVKGISSKTNRGIYQAGNVVIISWNARLSEHLGMFKAEMAQANAAYLMNDAMKLAALASACAIVENALPERHPYPNLYTAFAAFLRLLVESDHWQEEYVFFELQLLAEAGFGLDLSQCAATGTTEDLIYVSPKSGHAVSREAGEPYKEKLLKLPEFLLPPPLRGRNTKKPSPLEGEGRVGGDTNSTHAAFASHDYNKSHIERVRDLRKNSTDVERKLWSVLRHKQLEQFKFRRQQLIGNYIVDFFCADCGLIIELDGRQHAEQQKYDETRTRFFKAQGYQILRFWNNEVIENLDGVYKAIYEALKQEGFHRARTTPHPNPPPQGGRELSDGLALTGYFLEHSLLAPHGRKMPAMRKRFVQQFSAESLRNEQVR